MYVAVTSVLEPLDAVGLLKGSMVHCLAALRRHKHVLLNTMHIYLKVNIYIYMYIYINRIEIYHLDMYI